MKRKLMVLLGFGVIAVFVYPGALAVATTIAFHSNGVIQEGDIYDKVEVYDTPPAHTTVNMTGGYVHRPYLATGMFTYDSSMVNISGGWVEALETYDSSTVNVTGGYVGSEGRYVISHDRSVVNLFEGGTLFGLSFCEFHLQDSSMFDVSGGDVLLLVMPADSSVVNVHAGYIYNMTPRGHSTINVYGGHIAAFGENAVVPPTATVNIHGYDFNYEAEADWRYMEDPAEGWWVSKLSGYGFDDAPIIYWGLPDPAAFPNIRLIPEPATAMFLLAGGVFLVGKNRKRHDNQGR